MFDVYAYIIATEWPLYICMLVHATQNKYRCLYTLLQIYMWYKKDVYIVYKLINDT